MNYKLDLRALLFVAFAFAFATEAAAAVPQLSNGVTIAGKAGSVVPIMHWKIQSSAEVQKGGRVISRRGFPTKRWYPISAHATVMAGLLENGKYPNLFYGTNLRAINRGHFQIPWWYRTSFRIPGSKKGLHTFIKINGISSSADVWLNRKKIAGHKEIAGAYTTHEIDVTKQVQAGVNVLAIRVHPANPWRDLTVSWVDWNPAPPDYNMGIWRNVDILRSGPVSLRDFHVSSKLKLPGLNSAKLTVKANVSNDTDAPQNVTVNGQVAGVALHRNLQLQPHQTHTVVFNPATNPDLRLHHPKVWWPIGWGSHPLYHASLTAFVDDSASDSSRTTFGIRSVTSHFTKQGFRQFVINGKPILIRGGGWAPDMFLRNQPKRLATEFRYIHNLGLNTIRTEGKLERPDFYHMADRNGILILSGWVCCSEWEAWAKTGGRPWTKATFKVADESMASEARRLRDHPSVIAFLIGSDNAPPNKIAKMYVDTLHAADWPNPIVSAASKSVHKNQIPSPSGIKMSGPYAWVPPNYWYVNKVGGAFGFIAETSAGADIPRLPTLHQMLTPRASRALWKNPNVKQYHASPAWSPFSTLKLFDIALAHRYGKPTSLADYVEKSQLANYDVVRAQFEAYNAHMNAKNPSTGVIYWMLNSAWPSLHWHLMNYDFNPAGAYFGAQKANQAVHIQYSYDNRSIMAINHTLKPLYGADARIRVYNLDGEMRYSHNVTGIDLPANRATQLVVIPKLKKLSSTYFVELELTNAGGQQISRNVYWLSNKPDQLNWAKSKWYTTPVSRYADFTALEKLPTEKVVIHANTRRKGKQRTTTVKIKAAPGSKNVALFLHLSIRQGTSSNSKPLLPITWSSNDVSMWPGETVILTAHYKASGKNPLFVRVSGWNVSPRSIPVALQ